MKRAGIRVGVVVIDASWWPAVQLQAVAAASAKAVTTLRARPSRRWGLLDGRTLSDDLPHCSAAVANPAADVWGYCALQAM
jgi:hypothetical protein